MLSYQKPHSPSHMSELFRSHAFGINENARELDTLLILQALQYLALRFKARINLQSSTPVISSLVHEFHFKGINLIPKQTKDHRIVGLNIADFHRQCVDGPFFLRDSLHYLSEKMLIKSPPALTIPIPNSIAVRRHAHLGDLFSIAWGIEEYFAMNQPERAVTLSGPPVIRDIISLLNCTHVSYTYLTSRAFPADDLFSLCSWRMPWMLRFSAVMAEVFGGLRGLNKSPGVSLPAAHHPDEVEKGAILCQFDTRSGDTSQIELAVPIIERFCGSKPITVIGGRDTKQYLGGNYKYFRGNLTSLALACASARLFVGCDSGIAHLAGLLKVPSLVVNFTDLQPVFHFFSGYQNTIIVDRRLFESNKFA